MITSTYLSDMIREISGIGRSEVTVTKRKMVYLVKLAETVPCSAVEMIRNYLEDVGVIYALVNPCMPEVL